MERSRISVPITEKEKRLLRGYGVQVACPKRTILFASGDPADRFYLIEEGWVNIYRLTSEGHCGAALLRRTFWNHRRPVRGRTHSLCRDALQTVFCYSCPKMSWTKGREDPLIFPRVAEIMAQRVVEAEEIICDLTSQQVPQRLAHLLLRMAKQYARRLRLRWYWTASIPTP